MLFDIYKRQWDEEILEYFNIPKSMLPEVKPSSCIYGYTNENLIGGSIPIQVRQAISSQRFSDSAASVQEM